MGIDNKIHIVYLDDSIDTALSDFLVEYKDEESIIEYNEYLFSSKKLEECLKDEVITRADIIILDSQLYSTSDLNPFKLTGEQLRIILKKHFPYKQLIVITQNNVEENKVLRIFKKYNINDAREASEYYNENLRPVINEMIHYIRFERETLKNAWEIPQNDKFLLEKIENSMGGLDEWDELTTEKVDELIKEFKLIEELINDGLPK